MSGMEAAGLVSDGPDDAESPTSLAAEATEGLTICAVWDADYPWDVRMEKICRALTRAGHQVHLVARNEERSPVREERPEAVVHRLRPWPLLPKEVDAALSFPAFVHPRWHRRIEEVVDAQDADMILCRDLPLAPAAVWIARDRDIPCVVDLAENYPAMLRASCWDPSRFKLRNIFLRNPALARMVERWVLRRADHLLVVVEEARTHYAESGVPEEKMTVVSNTPEMAKIRDVLRNGELGLRPAQGQRRAVYLGGLQPQRGLDDAIEAVDLLAAQGDNSLQLDIIGTGSHESHLRELARQTDVEERINFHGWLPHDEALGLVARCQVGLVPHRRTDHTSTTIPNKLFDYMALGVPVVASRVPPVRRIVEDTGSGLIHRDGDPADLARRLEQAMESSRWLRMRQRGREAVDRRYNWSADRSRLLRLVEGVADVQRATVPRLSMFDAGSAVKTS